LSRFRFAIFVVSASAHLLCGCSGSTTSSSGTENEGPLPTGPDWIKERAEILGLSAQEAADRDRELSESEPPEYLEDTGHLRRHSVRLWADTCALCHGLGGDPPSPFDKGDGPRTFGTVGMSMGFFFGGDKMRAGLFRVIKYGRSHPAPRPSMPAFGESLAKEEIWGLVRHIEDEL
jgi:mono/diheme cytochrome c family protein